MVVSGETWGSQISFNHKFDFLPDYIVFEPPTDPEKKRDSTIAAGFFGTFWEFDPKMYEAIDYE